MSLDQLKAFLARMQDDPDLRQAVKPLRPLMMWP